MEDFNYADWVDGTYQTSNDTTKWNGTNPKCAIDCCENEIEMHDEYCDSHQKCVMCGDNDECGCEDEWSNATTCCESSFWGETDICSSCKEHAISRWDEAVDNCKN